MRCTKEGWLTKYKQILFDRVCESSDNEMVVRYADAVDVFDQMLDEMMFDEYKKYDWWGNEI